MRRTPVTWPRAELQGPMPARGARFSLLVGEVQIPLSRGEVLMGRSRSCQVLLDDMLVSRHHARFLVSRGALFIEDLGSSNGVRVNETPIAGPTPLNDGDRIIVGTQEIFVRSEPEESVPAESGDGPRANRPTLPVAKPVAVGSQPPSGSEPAPAKKSVHPGAEVQDTTVHTEKQDGLLTMARMADRMMTMGRTDAAARLLGDHLRSVLIGAHVGKQLPPVVADTVGTHGMKLTEATRQGEWANIAVELHLMCRRVLPEKSVAVLEQVLHRVPSIDRHLLGRYQAFLKEIAADLDPEQRTIVDRICALPSR